eukprot:CAMPEP_0119044710 /NCGR_PEP_ID=MMETSP1177-20130426/33789_1 /TAXON_ID=2985 /ORGANISM="Ochromonas sp, Strain CCMP1899" /LENGTH=67 /DNA_ID=CAMNT_0007015239 /DNA_START=1 /DNA_END=201 /DNA_ORIENTATION=-
MQSVITNVKKADPSALASAFSVYSDGGNSIKSDDSERTIQGFSIAEKTVLSITSSQMAGEKWFDIYA